MVNFVQRKPYDLERIGEILEESKSVNWFTNNGPVKNILDRELEHLLWKWGATDEHHRVLTVNNGTSACHMIFHYYLKTQMRRKWLVPAFTFPTPVIGNMDIEVRVSEIDPDTYTIPYDSEFLDWADGVVITNLFGTSAGDLEKWEQLSKEKDFVLVFDNASSPLGPDLFNYGAMSFGSLHHTKPLGFGEGGFIVCTNNERAELERILNFGFDSEKNYDIFSSNYKISDVSAAFILDHIRNYDYDKHMQNQSEMIDFIESMKDCDWEVFRPEGNDDYSKTLLGNLPIVSKSGKCNAEELVMKLRSDKVEANRYYKPLRLQRNMKCVSAMHLYMNIINLPLHAGLTDYQLWHMKNMLSKLLMGYE